MSERGRDVTPTYKSLMVEVRARNDALDLILENRNGLGPIVVRECSYLQIRIMCELIALACVVAHDDLTQTQLKALRKTYHAANILDALEQHHESFFPRAATRSLTQIGHHVDFVPGQLDKAGLKTLWEKCGRYLHKGTVNQLSKPQPLEKDFADVRAAQSALIGLLNQHVIAIRVKERWLLCDMRSGPDGRGLTVAIADAAGGPAEMRAPD